MSLHRTTNLNLKRGFTLIELMVTMGIMVIIITIIAFSQGKYTSGASLKNVANEVGLSLRQAQIYGISVRELSAGSGEFSSGYGMVFSTVGGNNNKYIFFADRGSNDLFYNGDWSCATGGTNECISIATIPNNNVINQLCVIQSDNSENCSLGRIDVVYVRPKTDTHFTFFDTSLINVNYVNAKGAKIKIQSPKGEIRVVTVYTTGQISVQ